MNLLLLSALLGSIGPSQPLTPTTVDPPIHVWFNSDGYYDQGDRAKVYVRTNQDGYVVILRADGEGRVRVLFPLDPGSDNYLRGDKKYEIRSRGDREVFVVEERSSGGVIVAAYSTEPFRFDEFA